MHLNVGCHPPEKHKKKKRQKRLGIENRAGFQIQTASMVKNSKDIAIKQLDEGLNLRSSSGNRRQGSAQDGKCRDLLKTLLSETTAGRHSCAVNGPEGNSSASIPGEVDSVSKTTGGLRERMSGKRGNSPVNVGAGKKGRMTTRFEGREVEMEEEQKEFKVIVRFGEENGLQALSPVKLTTILKNQVGEITIAKVLRDGNLMIICNTEEQRDRACRLKEIGRHKVINVSHIEKGIRLSKGVIWGIPVEVSVEEIKSNLRGGKLKDARRLQVFKNGEKRYSESILLEFDEVSLPPKVFLGYMTYSVRVYVPRPLRCFKCQRFGHTAQYCKGKRRCARCGEDHEYELCVKTKPARCCSCGGNHSVAYGGCEVMKREVQVQQVRMQDKLSYAEAAKVVKQKHEIRHTQIVSQPLEPPESNRDFVKRLITFIAGVINATKEIKSKTERIQVIVKAAVSHLKIDDLRWEEVRDEPEAEKD